MKPMAHKEWEPDEFLDEFLDFDYRKPVPDGHRRDSKGLPASEKSEPVKEQKNYGLGDEYKVYEDLRKKNNGNVGKEAPAPAEADNLRSSDALHTEILEPLSARNVKKNDFFRDDAAGSGNVSNEKPAAQNLAAPVEVAEPKTGKKFKFGHGRAAELASGALGAAKKFVASDEDEAPETIPSAAASMSDLDGLGRGNAVHDPYVAASHKPAPAKKEPAPEVRDELSELFAELGEPANDSVLSSEENEALAQAQHDAYDRYRGNYVKGVRKRMSAGKVGWFPKWLSRIYVIALAAFAAMMVIMNVLPAGMLIAFFVILGLLSIIIIAHLRRENVSKAVRVLASMTAIVLILLFGVGTAYSMGTLSFLDNTSVKNENRVGSITREPFNVCITGIDVEGTIDEQGRSDVNMIVTVNPKTEQILMTSIPRDYQIYMPDKDNAMDKLTHTGFYSVETTIGAEEDLLDTKINYYVKVNFATVKKFIDAVGGIDVYSEYEFTPVKLQEWTVQEGWNHMNGEQALAFARERKAFIDGDNQRIKNQQAVFEAVLKKAMSSKTMVLSYNKVLTNLGPYFQTSFSSGELRSLIKLQLAKDPDWKMYKNTIIGGNGSLPTYSTGNAYAYVMTQDETSIENAKTLINAVLNGELLDKDDEGNVFVTGGEESGDPEGE